MDATVARVLVIDADASLRSAIASALTTAGHEVETVASSEAGLALARASVPDVVVFDDLALCEALRSDPSVGRAALCVLSEDIAEERRVAAFEAGADDYLAKPHSMRELVLRVRALARRRKRKAPVTELVTVGSLRIDREARRVDMSGVPLLLTRREFDVLFYLSERPGRVQTREILIHHVWGEVTDSGRVVDTTIKRLRKKLGKGTPTIRTVRGVGYKLE